MLFDMVKLMRDQRPDLIIYGAHMELACPSIEDGIRYCMGRGATHIIAHPYMLAPGRHASEDIPRMVAHACEEHPGLTFEVTEPLGVDAALADLVFRRAGL